MGEMIEHHWSNGIATLYHADAREIPLPDKSVHMCVTSPPYWGLRDYGLGEWEGGDVECGHEKPISAHRNGAYPEGPRCGDYASDGLVGRTYAAIAGRSNRRRASGLSRRWASGWRTSWR